MRVRTSCRLEERAEGGMAGCLVQRACERDPAVDSELMPADVLLRRALLHRFLFGHARSGRNAAETGRRLSALLGLSGDAIGRWRGRPRDGWEELLVALPCLHAGSIATSQAQAHVHRAHRLTAWIAAGVPPFDLLAPSPRTGPGTRVRAGLAAGRRYHDTGGDLHA